MEPLEAPPSHCCSVCSLYPDVLSVAPESVVRSGEVQVTSWIKSSSTYSHTDTGPLLFPGETEITPLEVWLQLGSPEVKTGPVCVVQEAAMCCWLGRDPGVDYS